MPTTIVLSQLPQESVLQGLQILESSLASGDMAAKKFLGLWAWGLLARCREAGQMASEEIGVLRDLGKRAVWLLRGLRAGTDYLAQEQSQDVGRSDMGPDDDREEEAESQARDSPRHGQEHQGLETTSSSDPPADDTLAEEAEAVQPAKSTHTVVNQPGSDDPLAAAKASLLSSLTPQAQATMSATRTQDPTQPIANGHSASSDMTSAGQPETDEQRGQAIRLYATLDMIITIVGEFYGQRDLLEGRLVWGEIDLGSF